MIVTMNIKHAVVTILQGSVFKNVISEMIVKTQIKNTTWDFQFGLIFNHAGT